MPITLAASSGQAECSQNNHLIKIENGKVIAKEKHCLVTHLSIISKKKGNGSIATSCYGVASKDRAILRKHEVFARSP